MEKSTYQLRIDVNEKFYDEVSSTLGLKPKSYARGWSYEVILEEERFFYDVIEKFLTSLSGKYDDLLKLGIRREDISIWLIYAYNNQCNMQFAPNTMKNLGVNGITLCISCYEAGYE